MSKAKALPTFKKGQWVETVKRINGMKVGTLAVVGCDPFDRGSYDGDKYQVMGVVWNSEDGRSLRSTFSSEEFRALRLVKKAPEFVVTWSTRYDDPLMHFKTRKEANAFLAKLKKRRGDGREAVESAVYKKV